MTPTNVSQILYDKERTLRPYSRVGDTGWVDSATPLNAANLNKSDVALFSLLNEPDGYVYQLIAKLNEEISSRLKDIGNLISALDLETAERKEEDNTLETYFDEEIKKLAEDFVKRLTTQVTELNKTIDDVNTDLNDEIKRATEAEDRIQSNIPTSVSQLKNDKGYLTEHQSLDNYYTKAQTDSAIDDAIDGIEIPEVDLSPYAKVTDIPTKVGQLENDKGYLTKHQSLANYVTTEQLEAKNYLESETFNTQAVKTVDDLILNCGNSIENMFQ